MSEPEKCPKCGTELPEDAPAGLCPKCLVAAGFESEAGSQTNRPKSDPEAPTINSPPPGTGFLPPSAEALADEFPQLEILELLGHGGMGAVYKARQTNLDRLVALKIIRPEATLDPAFAERFNREAKTLARLSHQQIVAVYDFGEVEYSEAENQPARPLYFFLMEYVDGATLRQLMRADELSPEQALAIVPQICDALQYAHDEGVVHRDIKPENILLDKRGRVKIADFGLAKLANRSEAEFTLTGSHQVMGTLRYMAPEQMEGSHAVDHRADIYSLGVVFYEMLTGEAPMGHFDPPSKKVEVDVRLDEVVLRSLAREPERRYQHASDVKTDVESISSSRSTVSFPISAHELEPSTFSAVFKRKMARRPLRRLLLLGAFLTAFFVGAVCYSLGYKPAIMEVSDVVWGSFMVLVSLGFLADILMYPRQVKGFKAAFALLCCLIAVLIQVASSPQPLLNWLYRIADQAPGDGDRGFFRLMLAILLAWLIWGAVRLRRKITSLEQSEQHANPELQRHDHPARDGKTEEESVNSESNRRRV